MIRRALPWILAVALGVLVSWIYFPAIRGDWIWDDQVEVPQNKLLRDPAGIAKAWFAPTTTDYFPLKSTVQWFEWHLWGDGVLGYHVTNVALHLLSALLLWRLLAKLGVRLAFFGGAIFAVHPMAVESVAWISELKNTLSLPPLLLAAISCVDYDRDRRRADYARALGWFAAALFCKTSVVMFPGVLLLHGWWRRGRVARSDLLASVPFFALSLALGIVTLWFQQHRALSGESLVPGSAFTRLAAAGLAVSFYLWKCLWPAGLVPVYPRWALDAPGPALFLPWAGMAALVALFWTRRATWGRAALFGLGSFVLCLLPVLGFVPMAYQRISWVSDHLAYLALAAFAAFMAAAASRGCDHFRLEGRGTTLFGICLAAIVAALAFESHSYASIYTGDAAFWRFTLLGNPECWMAQNDYGLALQKAGRTSDATARFREALRLKPDYDSAYVNLGNALVQAGRPSEAIGAYEEALRLKPAYADARVYLGFVLAETGRTREAVSQYEEAIRLKPNHAAARLYLGTALAKMGREAEAIACYQEAARLDPSSAETRYDWGNALGNVGRLAEAIERYGEALRLNPSYPEARANLGLALANVGRFADAIAQLREALKLKPGYPEAHAYLGFALAGSGRPDEAVAEYEAALQADPKNVDLRYNLAQALRAAGRRAEAIEQFEEAERLRRLP